MMENTDGETPNNARHRIFFKQPKRVPPFDLAFVQSSHKDGLKLLLSAAPEHCTIILFSNGPGAAYAIRHLFKRKFRLNSFALQLDLHDIELTGYVAYQFVRGDVLEQSMSRYFCSGSSFLHEISFAGPEDNVIDMFCLGPRFHDAMMCRGKGKSLVFAEEQ